MKVSTFNGLGDILLVFVYVQVKMEFGLQPVIYDCQSGIGMVHMYM